MTYTAREGREQILAEMHEAAAALMGAQEALGGAYELLDDQSADRLESELYTPVGSATKAALSACASFSARYGFEQAKPEAGEHVARMRGEGAREMIDAATALVGKADAVLAGLQDSMLPVEVGDQELRENLSAIRRTLAPLGGAARELERTLGR